MNPPMNSAFDLYLTPKRLPTLTPTKEKQNVVIPMIMAASSVLTSAVDATRLTGTIAKVIPTARASILVATAMRNMVLTSSPASAVSSFLERASRIMLKPIRANSTKATHGAMASMYFSKREPRR